MKTIAKPFGALLMWLYEFTSNYGIAVILFALLVKIILLPFMMKSKLGTMRMSRLTDQMKELEKRHGANKQKYNEEMQKLYQREGVNPMSGCIWTLIPFPILIALYYAIRMPITTMMGVSKDLISKGGAIYIALEKAGFDFAAFKEGYIEIAEAQFISRPENWSIFSGFEGLRQLDYSFLGLDLGQNPNFKLWEFEWNNPEALIPAIGLFLIPIVAALLTWLHSKIMNKTNPSPADNATANSMTMMMPIMTLVFAFMMPAALGIYWVASTFFGMIQDVILNTYYTKKLDAEDAGRREANAKREAELEEKRKATELLKAQNATTANPNTSKRKQQKQQRLEQEGKANEWDRKHSPVIEKEVGPSQVGNRRYARGRAYDPDRYGKIEEEFETAIPEIDEIYEAEAAAKAAEEAEVAETVESEEITAVEETAETSEDLPEETESGENKEQ